MMGDSVAQGKGKLSQLSIFENKTEEQAQPATGPGGSTGKTFVVEGDRCEVCSKRVYMADKLQADGHIFHKSCFRCAHCNGALKLGTYASLQGRYYCKPHFKQLFALKGNYAEGFGEKKPQDVWMQGKDGSESTENRGSSAADEEERKRLAREAELERERTAILEKERIMKAARDRQQKQKEADEAARKLQEERERKERDEKESRERQQRRKQQDQPGLINSGVAAESKREGQQSVVNTRQHDEKLEELQRRERDLELRERQVREKEDELQRQQSKLHQRPGQSSNSVSQREKELEARVKELSDALAKKEAELQARDLAVKQLTASAKARGLSMRTYSILAAPYVVCALLILRLWY